MRLTLVHPTIPEETTAVEWDETTGELTGQGAALIKRRAAAAAAAGSIGAPPHPTTHEIGHDPLKCRRDLALIISTHWIVPEELAAALPPRADDQGDATVEVVY